MRRRDTINPEHSTVESIHDDDWDSFFFLILGEKNQRLMIICWKKKSNINPPIHSIALSAKMIDR